MASADSHQELPDHAHPAHEPREEDAVEDYFVDGGSSGPDAGGSGDEADDGVAKDQTLLEVLRENVVEEDIPPHVKDQIDSLARRVRSVVPRINIALSLEFTRSMEELRRKMASPAADAARRVLDQYNIDTRRLLEPVVKKIEAPTALVNVRISDQISASLPMDSFRRNLDPLIEEIARSAIPRDLLRGIDMPQSAMRNLYGPEFDRIAGKLFDFQKLFKNVDWETLKTGWYPPNWDPERGIEQFASFIELARQEALSLAWVPNTELTYLLLEADDRVVRAGLLIERQAVVLADCRSVLAEFGEQTFLVTQLERALDACEAGFHESAQAHAASIIDTALRALFTPRGKNNWSYKWTVKPRLHTGEDWKLVSLGTFRMLPTSVALLSVLKEFWTEKGDPVPTIPNRHAAAHAVTAEQYTNVNAIKFMMLATTMLAEVEHGGWAQLLKKTEAA